MSVDLGILQIRWDRDDAYVGEDVLDVIGVSGDGALRGGQDWRDDCGDRRLC